MSKAATQRKNRKRAELEPIAQRVTEPRHYKLRNQYKQRYPDVHPNEWKARVMKSREVVK